jgi:hypothetical protein
MDRYLEKRSSMSDIGISPPNKEKKKGKFSRFRAAMKAMLDVDQILDINNVDHKQSTVFQKRTWKDKVIDELKGSDSVNVDVDVSTDEPEARITPIEESKEEEKRSRRERRKPGIFEVFSRHDPKPRKGDHIPVDQVNQVLEESGIENPKRPSVVAHDEFRTDLREFIKITYKLIKKLPPETLRTFKESQEFKHYVDILDKYNLLRKRPDE